MQVLQRTVFAVAPMIREMKVGDILCNANSLLAVDPQARRYTLSSQPALLVAIFAIWTLERCAGVRC